MKTWSLLPCSLLVVLDLFAGDSLPAARRDSTIPIEVKKDARIDILNQKFALGNRKQVKPHMVRAWGYRLQVISTQNRKDALALKADLLRRFPEQQVYLLYQSPLFRVRLGNFRTRQEAQAFISSSLADHPGVFVVRDVIVFMWYPAEEQHQ